LILPACPQLVTGVLPLFPYLRLEVGQTLEQVPGTTLGGLTDEVLPDLRRVQVVLEHVGHPEVSPSRGPVRQSDEVHQVSSSASMGGFSWRRTSAARVLHLMMVSVADRTCALLRAQASKSGWSERRIQAISFCASPSPAMPLASRSRCRCNSARV